MNDVTDLGLGERTTPAGSAQPNRAALAGVRIADLTQYEAGPSCTEILAWLGAEVIKVEEPTKGEIGRHGSTDKPGADGAYFLILNANKCSVTANLKEEQGRDLLRRLIAKSDVFIENFGPGTIERLGFDYEAVARINPAIIYAQIKGFASDGPNANFPCLDILAQAAGGVMSMTGERNGRPLIAGAHVGDTGSGLHCAIGILAALYQRQFTGQGQRIEIAMQEAVIGLSRAKYAAQALVGPGEAVKRSGNSSGRHVYAPCDVYPCKGGGLNDYCYVYIKGAKIRPWENLLRIVGREDLIGNPQFATPKLRVERLDEVNEIVAQWTRQHDKRHVMKTFMEVGVYASAVMDTRDLLDDPHLKKRGAFVTVDHPVRGEFTIPGCPIKMSGSPVEVKAAPLLGADNNDVYGKLLGIPADELAALREQKII